MFSLENSKEIFMLKSFFFFSFVEIFFYIEPNTTIKCMKIKM